MKIEYGSEHAFYDNNMATFQLNTMKQYGNLVALIDAQTDRQYTYADLIDRTQRLAAGLRDIGMRKGDVLCILTYNHIDYHVTWFAVSMIGGTLHTAAPSYIDDDIFWRFQQCKTTFLLTTPDQVKRITKRIDTLKIIVYNGDIEGHVTYDSLMSRGRMTEAVAVDPAKDVCILLSSSGTTGLPKHVMLTHRNIIANLPQMQECLQHRPGMVAIVSLAMFHHYGIQACVNTGLYNGVTMVIMARYQLNDLLALIQKHEAQILQLVPPTCLQIVKHPRLHEYDLSSITSVTSGGAPLGIELERKVKQVFGLNMCGQGYGMTECGHIAGNGPAAYKEGTVGIPQTGVKLKIVDVTTGRTLPPYQSGEILVRGPQVTIGYLSRSDYSKTCFDDEGYLKTGDLGYLDSDGFLFYTDRLKELIKYKATQVAPAYLEDVLKKHPDIADAAVVGILDEEAGELPKAFVVRQPGSKVTEHDVHKYINEHVASYMRLRGGVEFTDNIPKTASGKIIRRLLRDREKKSKL